MLHGFLYQLWDISAWIETMEKLTEPSSHVTDRREHRDGVSRVKNFRTPANKLIEATSQVKLPARGSKQDKSSVTWERLGRSLNRIDPPQIILRARSKSNRDGTLMGPQNRKILAPGAPLSTTGTGPLVDSDHVSRTQRRPAVQAAM